MEDTVVIDAIKNEASRPNHKIPIKPIDMVKAEVDKLHTDIKSIKADIQIILDHINYKEKAKHEESKSWWW
jgi:hypothetical protein